MATIILQVKTILRVMKVPLYLPSPKRKHHPVQPLNRALQTSLKQAEVSRPSNGGNGLTSSSAGVSSASVLNGTTSQTTGTAATPLVEAGSQTGLQHGGAIAVAIPATAVEATQLAERLVADLLPPSLQAWLHATEYHQLVAGSVGGRPPAAPERTPELESLVRQSVNSLSKLVQPASTRGAELDAEVAKLFAAFNIFTGDQGKLNLQMQEWCDELEEFPLYAIRQAFRWAKRGCDRLPSIRSVIEDTRLAVGTNVLSRKQLLTRWLCQ